MAAWTVMALLAPGAAALLGRQLWPWGGTGMTTGRWAADLGLAALAVGLAAALDLGPFRGRDGHEARMYVGFAASTVLGLALTLWPAHSAVLVWESLHTPTVPVTAEVTGCSTYYYGDEGNTKGYRCTYHWEFRGQPREQVRNAAALYPDGRHLQLRMGPNTGVLIDDNDWPFLVRLVVACGFLCLFLTQLVLGVTGLPQWLRQVRSGPPVPAPPADDAAPPADDTSPREEHPAADVSAVRDINDIGTPQDRVGPGA
ncbi:hypothetical protein [Kitasatospora sp. NPDC059571]|uniref:hypothetical protein n=1 Tax=Kitasatospora sp. NPDC059571 TaxID=3346871 RepID=UPI003689C18E